MKRSYNELVEAHLSQHRQMVFLVGPRQVGKTTTCLAVASKYPKSHYFNWDTESHRQLIVRGGEAVAQEAGINIASEQLPLLIFDEIHKYPKWKNFLKGFFDLYEKKTKIIVTGSTRLDIYKRGGDSLMGRYFSYRLHPLSIGEIVSPHLFESEVRPEPMPIDETSYEALLRFGGFPEPFLKANDSFYHSWKRLRSEQLFRGDLRDLTRIQEIGQMQVLAELLWHQIGQLTTFSNLATKAQISVDTVRRWIQILKSFYYCFTVKPWSKNISRSLLKEPKIYLWDWSYVLDEGARLENFIASHLLKAVHFWTDRGFGDYGLFYLRTKEKKEVDFLVVKNNTPWFLVEVKAKSQGLSPALFQFQKETRAAHAFQVAFDLPFVKKNCFEFKEPILVPAQTFLSQLP